MRKLVLTRVFQEEERVCAKVLREERNHCEQENAPIAPQWVRMKGERVAVTQDHSIMKSFIKTQQKVTKIFKQIECKLMDVSTTEYKQNSVKIYTVKILFFHLRNSTLEGQDYI